MADKSRIAKNTIALFLRMGIMMIISLYTSRIVLQQLGASDFGSYNVVGGLVVLIGFLTGPLSQGIQRFINYFLGRGEKEKLNQIFTAGVTVVAVFGLFIVLVGETVGVFVLNRYLNIPEERMIAANWVLQFSLLSVFASMLIVPLQGLILAHEDMKFYAYISIFEALLKLTIVFLLSVVHFDKLILYALLLSLTSYLILGCYYLFCKRKYEECHYHWHKNIMMYKSLLQFSGWNILGSTTSMVTVQGMNIVLNLFFNTVVNAARGVAVQISSMVDNTISNIQTAMNPQLTQLYAQGKYDEMRNLLFDNFKWNFFLYWLIGLPLFFKVDSFLELWLGAGFVPEFTAIFIRITVFRCLLKCFERPMNTIIFATGEVKLPNIFSSSSYVVEIMFAIALFAVGFPPYWCFMLDLLAVLAIVIFQMFYIHARGLFPFRDFFSVVVSPLVLIVITSTLLTGCVNLIQMNSLVSFIVVCFSSIFISGVSIAFIGLNRSNRIMVLNKIKRLFNK